MLLKHELGRLNGDYRVRGGTVIIRPSVSDPAGLGNVVCDKHPRIFIPLSNADLMSNKGVVELAEQALATCGGCLDVEAHKTSRWPNAGEPGGAEL